MINDNANRAALHEERVLRLRRTSKVVEILDKTSGTRLVIGASSFDWFFRSIFPCQLSTVRLKSDSSFALHIFGICLP